DLKPGNLVEYGGVTLRGRMRPGLRLQWIRTVGESPLPRPVQLSPDNPFEENADGRYVQIKGYIPALVRYGTRLTLQLLVQPGLAVELYCANADSPEARDLGGCEIEATGVLTVRYDSSGKKIGARIY